MKCRFCENELQHVFADLLNAPPSNSYLTLGQLDEPEAYFPLKVFVCEKCWLVQVDEYKKSDEIFDKNYAYFSSMSSSWLAHSQKYVEMISKELSLVSNSQVVEIASNDGYLLQYFQEKNIDCLGVEPTASTAAVSLSKGIDTRVEFFSVDFAQQLVDEGKKADLILGNNVLAHVPDINDFVGGLKLLLKESGTITMEFPHILNILKFNQFDTIYHEHFSYLSLLCVEKIFKKHGLIVYHVEEISTHGGSLRIYAGHEKNTALEKKASVETLLEKELNFGLQSIEAYKGFQEHIDKVKYGFSHFLLEQKKAGQKVAAYGAAAKGNTLLNYCGIKKDLIDFVVDAAPSKQDKYLPGSHIPIVCEARIKESRPDYIIIFPWNIKEEVVAQLSYVREWGAKFIVTIPELEIF
jgi:hypothetical protein